MSEKTVKPDKYQLNSNYSIVNVDKSKLDLFVVYREKKNYRFFDIVVVVNGRLFVMKPCDFYSRKSLNVYRWTLDTLAMDSLAK